MITELLVAMFMSCSFRTANIQPNPIDYEYAGGLSTKRTVIESFRERENGLIYDGFLYNKKEDYTEVDIYYKEAKNIDYQSFSVFGKKEVWRIGLSLNSMRWNHGITMLMIALRDEHTDFKLEVGNNRMIFKSVLKDTLDLSEKVFLEPSIEYRYISDKGNINNFVQAKIKIGYKLN